MIAENPGESRTTMCLSTAFGSAANDVMGKRRAQESAINQSGRKKDVGDMPERLDQSRPFAQGSATTKQAPRVEYMDEVESSFSMIAHLRGKLIAKHPNQAIVEAAGVGYDVTISVPTFSELGSTGAEVALHVHTHVREDAIALFGFVRPEEKQLFEKLLSVSGIGPKLAITILSGMAAPEMVASIKGNDVAKLTKIPGIGKKTAERMVLELRDKLKDFGMEPAAPPASPMEEDVLSALTNLGYQRPLAEKAVATVMRGGVAKEFDAMFREALALLSK